MIMSWTTEGDRATEVPHHLAWLFLNMKKMKKGAVPWD